MDFSPQWHALGSEAELAAAQLAVGVTALGRADHTRRGDYAIAFFSLATGLERLGKLIVIGDHVMSTGGGFPDNKFLKDTISHDLGRLLDHCEVVSAARRSSAEYAKRPNDIVHQGIIQTLREFATMTRYYNLDLLVGGKGANLAEPIGAWWKRVGEPILANHYTYRQREKDQVAAEAMSQLLGEHATVLHHSETGESIRDVATFVRHAGANRVVQKYGQLYALQIVRWLSYAIFDIAHDAAYKQNIEAFLGVHEPFVVFLNDDRYFRGRKTWSIYP
jgi:hypothetical protein